MKDSHVNWIRPRGVTLALVLVVACGKSRSPGTTLEEPQNPDGSAASVGAAASGGTGGLAGSAATGRGGAAGGGANSGAGAVGGAAGGGRGGAGGAGGTGTGAVGGAGGSAAGGSGGTSGTAGGAGASGTRDAATSGIPAPGATADASASVDLAVIPPPAFLDAAVFVAPPTASMPAVDACARAAMVQCAALRECSPDQFRISYGTDETCREVLATGCRYQLALPGSGDSVARVEACTAARMKQSCADRSAGVGSEACRVPAGTLGEGALCNSGLQCGEGLFCNLPVLLVGTTITPGSCGRCAKVSAAGGPCTVVGGCQTGVACFFSGPTLAGGQCVPFKATGDTCTTRDICQAGRCVAGLCVALPRGGLGADCNELPCDSAQSLYCNGLTRRCDGNPPPARVGEYCGPRRDGSGAFVQCEAGTACTGLAEGGFVRTCEPASKEGEPCATAQDPLGRRCLVGLTCVMGKCERPNALICVAAP